jgi:hypothetical protein
MASHLSHSTSPFPYFELRANWGFLKWRTEVFRCPPLGGRRHSASSSTSGLHQNDLDQRHASAYHLAPLYIVEVSNVRILIQKFKAYVLPGNYERSVHAHHPRVRGLEWESQRRYGCGFFVMLLRSF